MRRYILMVCCVLLSLLSLLLAACQSGGGEPIREQVTADRNIDIGTMSLLVWTGQGISAREHSGTGELKLLNEKGETSDLMPVPDGVSRVHACGTQSTSPDNRYFTFMMGDGDDGTLYQMDGTNTPQSIASTHALTCIGRGAFLYAPDSSRFGYIQLTSEAIASNSEFPAGTLRIISASSREVQGEFQNVVGFDFADTATTFISFFPNVDGQPTEAGVFRWSSGTPEEVTTLFADDDCTFRSASISAINDDAMVAMMGQRCGGSANNWRVYRIDAASGSASLLLSGNTGSNGEAGYAPNNRTSMISVGPSGEGAFFSYPNGLAQHIANWQLVTLADGVTQGDVVTFAVMPRYSEGGQIYDPAANATPVISSDGRWVAVVSNNRTDDAVLHVMDLNTPNLPPLTVSAGDNGNTISAITFTPDSTKVVFVAGGHSFETNSLFSLDLATGTEARLIRGRYTPEMVVAPGGGFVAVTEWQIATDSNDANYLNLEVINLSDNSSKTVFAGAVIADNRVTDQLFIYPLSWRR